MGSPVPSVALLTADAPGVLAVWPPQWGVFWPSGAPVLAADAVASVEYTREYDVSDYPQEQGSFESYNKVQQPFDAKVTLLSGLTRQQLLNTLEPVVASLDLVSVVTPEVSYPSANLTRYSIRPRTARSGVSLVTVDVWCKEIRVTATTALGGTARPVGQVAGGSSLSPGTSASADPSAPPPAPPGPTAPPQQAATPPGAVDLATGTGLFYVPRAPITTGSTSAATPTASGPVQAVSPTDSIGQPSGAVYSPLVPPI